VEKLDIIVEFMLN